MEKSQFNDLKISAADAPAAPPPTPAPADTTPGVDVASLGPSTPAGTEAPSTPAPPDSVADAPGDGATPAPPAAPGPVAPPAQPESMPPGERVRGYIRHDDYTQKTQRLADLARGAVAAKTQYEQELATVPGLKDLVQLMDADPELTAAIQEVYAQKKGGNAPALRPTRPNGAAPPPAENALEDRLSRAEHGLFQATAEKHLRDMQGRHHLTNEDLSKVEDTAIAHGLIRPGMPLDELGRSLEAARRIAFFDVAESRGEDAARRRVSDARAAGRGSVPATPAIRSEYNPSGKSLRQVTKDAIAAGARGL